MNIESSILNLSINGADVSANAADTEITGEGSGKHVFRNMLNDMEDSHDASPGENTTAASHSKTEMDNTEPTLEDITGMPSVLVDDMGEIAVQAQETPREGMHSLVAEKSELSEFSISYDASKEAAISREALLTQHAGEADQAVDTQRKPLLHAANGPAVITLGDQNTIKSASQTNVSIDASTDASKDPLLVGQPGLVLDSGKDNLQGKSDNARSTGSEQSLWQTLIRNEQQTEMNLQNGNGNGSGNDASKSGKELPPQLTQILSVTGSESPKPVTDSSVQPASQSQVNTINGLTSTASPLNESTRPGLTVLESQTMAGSREWASEMNNHIRWMGRMNISSAEIKLNPAELGALEIKIMTHDDQTSVSFVAGNAATKEIIEASMPKLREMLGNSGLQLSNSSVEQENMSGQQQASTGSGNSVNTHHLEGPENQESGDAGKEKLLGQTSVPSNPNEIDFYV